MVTINYCARKAGNPHQKPTYVPSNNSRGRGKPHELLSTVSSPSCLTATAGAGAAASCLSPSPFPVPTQGEQLTAMNVEFSHACMTWARCAGLPLADLVSERMVVGHDPKFDRGCLNLGLLRPI